MTEASDDLDAAREAAALHPRSAAHRARIWPGSAGSGTIARSHCRAAAARCASITRSPMRGSRSVVHGSKPAEPDKALEAFDHLEEDDEVAPKIAAARAMKAQARSDAGYVRHLFDQFAIDYDERMIRQLGYAAPRILRALADMVMAGRDSLSILDLGCGTGLTGVAFEDVAYRLDGIDLSPAMTEKARARNLYDALTVADIETALRDSGAPYDLIVAADTLVYLGDLATVFGGAHRRLKPDGFFLFTVESKDGESFELGPKRRWRHSDAYLRDVAEKAGFDVAGFLTCAPRHEANVPVAGFAVALSLKP
ncbi:MAG: methyltransferase domain-containing protein [Rhizomicrobium sp.]